MGFTPIRHGSLADIVLNNQIRLISSQGWQPPLRVPQRLGKMLLT